MKNKKIVYALIVVLIGLLGVHLYFNAHPLKLISTEITVDVDEKYNYKDNISYVYLGSVDDVKIDKKIDTSKIDDYDITYSYKGNKLKCHISVEDKKGPILKLKNYKTDTVEELTPDVFVESCEDYSEFEIHIETEDLSSVGKTTVVIKAVDKYGNETVESCELERIEDTTPPIINGVQEYVEVMQGDYFDYQAVSVEDDMDSNPSLEINGWIDFGVPGTYTVNYMAVDRTGNIASVDSTIVVMANAEANMRVVYLTFDDGPSYNTASVLDILDRYGVKATFFVTGNGQNYNDNIVRAYQSGHAIGLHTYTHDYATVYASVDAYFQDLNNVGDMVQNIIGYRPDIIRFPGGSSNTVSANYTPGIMSQLVNKVQEKGYQYYDWNVSSSDASGFGVPSATIVQSSTATSADKVMILFHDATGKETTVEALPAVIEYYKNQGYAFMPISKSTSFVCHHGVNN